MFLDEVLAAQKRGEQEGIASICSAHPVVIRQTLDTFKHPLIEATCNQVNQFGGYTGMTPASFVAFVRAIAAEQNFRFEDILLGGDHLGPHVWRGEAAAHAMANARVMIADYVKAGFAKLHLDCSMPLADDPSGPLDKELSARRAADLAQVAERSGNGRLHYVIGTEVPRPGGATQHEGSLHVTEVNDTRETIELHRRAFHALGLQSAWERVIAVVVQPGVEFGNDFVLPYRPESAQELSEFIQDQPMIYEAHSTDYQTREALTALVRDHFAILKVGPALTFAYRESIFSLAMIENECIAADKRSNILHVLDAAMTAAPQYWSEYYPGTAQEQAFHRKFSLSDRARYYWVQPAVQSALNQLMQNLGDGPLPFSLSSQFLGQTGLAPRQAITRNIGRVLEDYSAACEGTG
jgi:D-tagatose-1,6-bisphosphate aldolase subunit GatZ/KbaZ